MVKEEEREQSRSSFYRPEEPLLPNTGASQNIVRPQNMLEGTEIARWPHLSKCRAILCYGVDLTNGLTEQPGHFVAPEASASELGIGKWKAVQDARACSGWAHPVNRHVWRGQEWAHVKGSGLRVFKRED